MSGGGPLAVEIARTTGDLERLEPLWRRVEWGREEAAYEYFAARLRTRADVIAPFAVLVVGGGEPVAALAGRVELRLLKTTLGYRVVYAPRVRLLHVVDGGLVASGPAAREALVAALRAELAGGEVDAIGVPAAAARLRSLRRLRDARRAARAPAPDRAVDTAAARAARDLRGVRRLAELEHALADPPRR